MSMIDAVLKQWPMGEIKSFPRTIVSVTAVATDTTLYTQSTGKTHVIILSLTISKIAGAGGFLSVGDSAFTQRLPDLTYLIGTNPYIIDDGSLPVFIFEASPIQCRGSVAAASTSDVRVLSTVFEF